MPPPSLPTEVYERIFSLVDRKTLVRLITLSQSFVPIIKPLLCKDVGLASHGWRWRRQMSAGESLIAALDTDPEMLRDCRSLRWTDSSTGESLSCNAPLWNALYHAASRLCHLSVTLGELSDYDADAVKTGWPDIDRFTRLETLQVSAEFGWEPATEFLRRLFSPTPDQPTTVDRLHTLVLSADGAHFEDAERYTSSPYPVGLVLPPANPARAVKLSALGLRQLVWHPGHLEDVNPFFARLPALVALQIHLDPNRPPQVAEVLRECHQLRYLEILQDNEDGDWSAAGDGFLDKYLSDLTSLQVLVLGSTTDYTFPLSSTGLALLPSSLKAIYITCGQEYHRMLCEGRGETLEDALTGVATLRYISILEWLQPASKRFAPRFFCPDGAQPFDDWLEDDSLADLRVIAQHLDWHQPKLSIYDI